MGRVTVITVNLSLASTGSGEMKTKQNQTDRGM